MSTLIRLVRFFAPYKWLAVLSILLGTATVGSGIALMATAAYLISMAALQPSIAELQVAIVAVRFFGIFRGVFRYLERYTSHAVTLRGLAGVRRWFYEALEPLAPARLEAYRSGDLLSRLVGDIETLEDFFVRALAPPLTALLVMLGTGLFLGSYDEKLAVILIFFLALAGFGVPFLGRRVTNRPGREVVRGRAALYSQWVDGVQGMADLLAYDTQDWVREELEGQADMLAGAQLQILGIRSVQDGASSLLANLGAWAVLAVAISLVARGELDGVLLPVVVLAAIASFEVSLPLPQAAQRLESALEAGKRLEAVVDAWPEVNDPESPRSLPLGEASRLSVRGLSFRYAEDAPWAVKDLGFELPQGGRLAIVGSSGAGKSTVVDLLLRFWNFQEGEIWLGGEDVRSLRQEDVRRRMAVVSQDTYLFQASVRDNIRIANPDASETAVRTATEMAQLATFVETLPEGYDTWIGEHGVQLSAGQRQRLALARAFVRQAPLLVLDEATANLDALTEAAFFEELLAATAGRSLLLLTHRLVGMEAMDEILVLSAGRVVERGRHEELVKRAGHYARMWDLQNQVFLSLNQDRNRPLR